VKASRRVPLWQALVLPLAAVLIFFLLLEGGLALFGVKPTLQNEDPFVGFATNVPLFVATPGPMGRQRMSTAQNKLNYFNQQSFMREKPADTFRIFTLGGSTTFGRPYDDKTSFSGWLRQFLPVADRNKNWEVINAGGISYASYRVAYLMEELVNYQPDLFIIYTGHNEFLEERTFNQIRDIPPLVRSTVSLLAKTRTWSAMTSAMQSMGIYPEEDKKNRDNLALEAVAKLDQSAGLDLYTRDDSLRDNILEHYQISLERMVALARSAGAQVIFVTPASNLKDCTPFKSEHTQGIDPAVRQDSAKMLAQAEEAIRQENWNEALNLLGQAVALDPRHAGLQYRYGKTLLAMERFEEAEIALLLSRDEDVCPLRALTPMRRIVIEIAEEQGVGLVDYVDILDKRMKAAKGYPIPGEEFFLDHVHPTIEGHKILALGLIRAMTDQRLLQPGKDWNDQAIAGVAAKVESSIDQEAHGLALANLARVLYWAKKNEDAARLARQAQDIAGEYRNVAVNAASILTSIYRDQGQEEQALQLLYETIEKAPRAIELRWKLGELLVSPPLQQLEEGAAHLLLACQQLPNFAMPQAIFGLAMVRRGRLRIAYDSLMEALRLDPTNSLAQATLDYINPLLGGQKPRPQPPHILLDSYPSLAPRKLVQLYRDANGRPIPHGIEVEFYENGRVKRFLDISLGKPNGLEMTWDAGGRLLSRVVYRQGILVNSEPGK
jgi:tetratricopeptide (TPR) repeat protein